jgi:putative transposase
MIPFMQLETNNIYHVFNRGNNSQVIFFNRDNYLFFLQKIKIHITPFADILAWCLMPNHFHLMIYINNLEIGLERKMGESKDKYGVKWGTVSKKEQNLNQSIAIMLRSYTRAINKQESRTGSLFQMTTKATCLTDNSEITSAWFHSTFGTIINIEDVDKSYPQVCFNYVHQNPVSAKLVKTPDECEFSSYRDHAGLRNGKLINRERTIEFGLKI